MLCFAILFGILSLLFWRSYHPDYVVHSNDGPFGAMVAEQNRLPAIMTGMWANLNWVGGEYPAPSPTISTGWRLIASPLVHSKFFCPVALLIFGLCACYCFSLLKLSPLACIMGGLAAALSSHFFSTAAWGVAAQVICFGMNFLAIGLLVNSSGKYGWAKIILAGLCVGQGVMEGYDIGAIFSFFVAAFVIWESWTHEGAPAKKMGGGILRVALVAIFAGFMASQAVTALVGTQIKGVVGMGQDAESKARRWNEATMFSYPPTETLRLVIPGLFGYRMDTPKDMEMFGGAFENGQYWGRAGETPGAYETRQGSLRFSGGGTYAGILVVLVALWAMAQSLVKKDSAFTPTQRKLIWFWSIAAILSLLLCFGRFAPFDKFYRLLYALPYFSTIRNPAKFTHTFHWSLVILFAYGIHGLSRRYLEAFVSTVKNAPANFKTGWARANHFDKRWIRILFALLGASILGWMIYAGSKNQIERLIASHGIPDRQVAGMASFSIREAGLAVLFLAASVFLLMSVVGGFFSGKRERLGGILLAVLLVVDLGRANLPWIIQWNSKEKYATNPVIDFLREKPFEHRVAMLPFSAPPQFAMLNNVHGVEWAQHHFLYYNIQSLDRIQEPRVATENQLYREALMDSTEHLLRLWELTNTRYLFGAAGFVEVLNKQIDPVKQRFRIAKQFNLGPKPGVDLQKLNDQLQQGIFAGDKFTATADTNGTYAVIEFAGVLPRAKLFSNWQVATNDEATLKQISSADFDPQRAVLVANVIAPPASTNQDPGSVEIDAASYAPKRVVLNAKVAAPAVLLLNDKFDPSWKVTVDGKPETLLRCNFLMRGVQLQPGEHTVEFIFNPSTTGLKISLAAIALGILLISYLAFSKRGELASPGK